MARSNDHAPANTSGNARTWSPLEHNDITALYEAFEREILPLAKKLKVVSPTTTTPARRVKSDSARRVIRNIRGVVRLKIEELARHIEAARGQTAPWPHVKEGRPTDCQTINIMMVRVHANLTLIEEHGALTSVRGNAGKKRIAEKRRQIILKQAEPLRRKGLTRYEVSLRLVKPVGMSQNRIARVLSETYPGASWKALF